MHQNERKVRLSVDCTEQERMYIKMLATKNHMTISDYLLSFARKEMPTPKCSSKKSKKDQCKFDHEPNEETTRVLMETDKGKNLVEYESLEEFWKELGFDQDA